MREDLYPALGPVKDYEPEKWTLNHRFMVLLSIAGKKNKEIAEICKMDESRVSVILGDQRAHLDVVQFGSRVADQLIDVHSKLKHYAAEGLEKVMDELRDPLTKSETVVKIGFGLLDRAGYSAVQKQVKVEAQIPAEMASRMEEVAEELKEYEFHYEYVEPKMLPEPEDV